MRVMPLALEVQHGVDDVLERLRAGEAAVLGDVADEEGRDVLSLGREQQLRRRLAHLADAAGRRLELQREDRLHRVDDDERRLEAGDLLEDPLEAGLGEQVERRRADAEPLAARLDLVLGLLAGAVEHRARPSAPCAPPPAAAASTCRCPARRRAAPASPGTTPPPSTRSNSPMPVDSRAATVRSRCRRRAAAAPPRRPARSDAPAARRAGRRLRRAPRRASSTRRSRRSGRATSATARRTPGRRRRSLVVSSASVRFGDRYRALDQIGRVSIAGSIQITDARCLSRIPARSACRCGTRSPTESCRSPPPSRARRCDLVALRADDHDLVARRHVEAGDVGHQHVHAHRADDRRAAAADQHGAAAGEPQVEAVGVAGRHDRDRRRRARRVNCTP